MSLYQQLRDKHKLYCQGKRPSVLKAACEYIENMQKDIHITQKQTAEKYHVSNVALRTRYREIMKLLGIPPDIFPRQIQSLLDKFYRGEMQ